jgi:hypothetical protein
LWFEGELRILILTSTIILNLNIIIFIKTIWDHDIEFEIEVSNKEEMDSIIRRLRDDFVNEIKDYELIEVTREYRMTYFPF